MYINQIYPKKVHYHIRRYLIEEIPNEESEFAVWLRDRFREKDQMLTKFYEEGKFNSFSKPLEKEFTMEKNEFLRLFFWMMFSLLCIFYVGRWIMSGLAYFVLYTT